MAQAELVGCPNCRAEVWLHPQVAGFRCQYCGVYAGIRQPEPRWRPNPVRKLPGALSFNKPRDEPIIVSAVHVVRVSSKKRAVLCGICYKNTPYELKGCINDVNCMKYLLTTRFNFPEDSIVTLTEEENDSKRIPTKRNIQRWMSWLVKDCQPGDSLVFHYSGHGSQQKDYTGHEVDGYDETLLPLDFETAGMIVDNDINDTLVKPLPPGARLHAIIDACHSGTVLDLPYVCVFNPSGGKCAWEDHTPQNGMRKGTMGGEAISFSGCDDDQTSADTKALSKITSTGAMTYSFIKAIEKGEGNTYGSLLSSMSVTVREARQKQAKAKDKVIEGAGYKQGKVQARQPADLTNMLVQGGSYKPGKFQEPQLSSSYPFDVSETPFYL